MTCTEHLRIPGSFSMTSTRACGLITTSWRPMLSRAMILSVLVTGMLAVATGLAQSTNSLLADRIEAGDRKAALEMIGRVSVNDAQPDGTTPLHWAVYRVDEELVKALLARGAKPDVVNAYGASPLSEAARVANVNIVQMLLNAGANANRSNQDGETPLMLAARTGVVKVAETLVSYGANVNVREEFRSQTALMWAAAEGKPEMVAFLISEGAAVNERATANDW